MLDAIVESVQENNSTLFDKYIASLMTLISLPSSIPTDDREVIEILSDDQDNHPQIDDWLEFPQENLPLPLNHYSQLSLQLNIVKMLLLLH
jgi:hypothetical protein